MSDKIQMDSSQDTPVTETQPAAEEIKAKPEEKKETRPFKGRLSALGNADTSSLPIQIGYVYIALPMYIFFAGWLRLPVAMVMEFALTIGLVLAMKSAPKMDVSHLRKAGPAKLFMILLISVVWVYLSGIGKYSYQNFDHMWRNAILDKLVTSDWPVIVPNAQPFFQNPVTMIYYFALWLPAACVGKLWGLGAAHTFLFYWCVIGVLIVMLLISGLLKKASPWIALAFVFFSGLDAVGDFVLHNSAGYFWLNTVHIENWATGFQISCMSTQLFWVFNQAIPAWIITLLLMHQKDNKSVIWIYSFSFLGCTLPAIGLIPIVACIGIRRIVQMYDKSKPVKENATAIFRDACTTQNILSGLSITLISYLFLKSNSTSAGGFRRIDMKRFMMSYLLMALFEFLVYYFAIYSRKKRDPLYWTSLATLLVVPTIGFGTHIDFCMRASIPALVILFVLVIGALEESRKVKAFKQTAVIITLLVFGGITAYHEISRSVFYTIDHINNPDVQVVATEIDLIEDSCRNNFFGEYEDSFFFRCLAKQ